MQTGSGSESCVVDRRYQLVHTAQGGTGHVLVFVKWYTIIIGIVSQVIVESCLARMRR